MNRKEEVLQDVVIKFAGDSGDGMQLTGSQFTNNTALMGIDLATFPDFPAEIRAPQGTLPGVSGYQLRFSSDRVFTPGDECDVLVAMNAAALKTNLKSLKKGGKIVANEVDGVLHFTVIHPVEESKDKHILRPVFLLCTHRNFFQRLTCHLRDVHFYHLVIRETIIFKRIDAIRVVCKTQVLCIETIGVRDDLSALFQGFEICLQSGSVHGYQHIAFITRGEYVVR